MRAHHRITRTTLPERPLAEWFGIAAGAGLWAYIVAVFIVNMVSLP